MVLRPKGLFTTIWYSKMSSSSDMGVCSGVSDSCMDDQILNSEFKFVEFYAENVKTGIYIYAVQSFTW